jgi:D-amino-acid dehydrogenase
MHVAVLGAGVVGVTTAYYLAEAGHDVTIVDRESDVAQSCSLANGAQLSYSYVDAMASPAFLAKMPGLLAGIDRAIRVRPPINMDLIRWGFSFLGQCSNKKATRNTIANLALAQRSKHLLDELRPKLDGDFSYKMAGKLVLLRTERELAHARETCKFKAEYGNRVDVVSMDEAISIEPGLAHMPGPYAGAVYSPGDEVGDSQAFAEILAQHLRDTTTCNISLNTQIQELIVEKDELRAVATDQGVLDADAVVVCLGTWSPALLKPLGINTRIYPVRGYSVTLPPGPRVPSASVTDFGCRFVISRMNEQVRVAGFADFLGYSTSRDTERVQRLLDIATVRAPGFADYASMPNDAWGGFRPLTPDGRPVIGPTPIKGLFLNTGHGSFGWTLACASGERVSSMIGDQIAATETGFRRREYPSASPSLT